MKEPEAPMVALVLEKNFGEQLTSVVKRGEAWVVDSPANLGVANRLIGEGYQITTFKRPENFIPERSGAGMLEKIELHHGKYSRTPPYGRLEVYGAQLNDEFRRELEDYGRPLFRTGASLRFERSADQTRPTGFSRWR
jgi:hypothetical protein